MILYSFRGQEPTELPSRIRLDDGSTRTSLGELSLSELENIGFIGPITKPTIDSNVEKLEWNGSEYERVNLTEAEIEQRKSEERTKKLETIDYVLFWKRLVYSNFYKKLRTFASQSLIANTICTELIALLGDAKSGKSNIVMIQNYINILFLSLEFTSEDTDELQSFLDESSLNLIYKIPDSKYLSENIYDPQSHKITYNPTTAP